MLLKVLNNIIISNAVFPRWIAGLLVVIISFGALESQSQIEYITGTLTYDRTFVKDTVYIAIQDYTVSSGIKLTIEAGTHVKFRYGAGLIIDNGTLVVKGSDVDSVFFEPYHTNPGQFWKWNGITLQNIIGESQSYIAYAHITEAETAISIKNSKNIVVEGSCMLYCQDLGLSMLNSSFCYIVDCIIEDNYNGVEFYSEFLGTTSNNLILRTKIKNENRNINIFKEEGGLFRSNTISDNIIADGNNGIWVDNSGGPGSSDNIISRNIIINNGSDVGYGLFMANDSTSIINNIFWNNYVALHCQDGGHNSFISNNSFYENEVALTIGFGSIGNTIVNNTFSLNSIETFGFKDVARTDFEYNNLLNNLGKKDIVVNYTPLDITLNKNYWGTTSAIEINKLIYDRIDNPEIGSINYVPYLIVSDTINPISPPYKVIKQIVNSKVKVSWNANTEADLSKYHLYYGTYEDYTFSNKSDLGNSTEIVMSGDISIYDEIALTAVDSATVTFESQLTGHESPFAFAQIYPYAGQDTVICKFIEQIEILNATVPFSYNELYWSTEGDGSFDSEVTLFPTYYPGSEDMETGSTYISLSVISSGDTLIDGFQLRIIDDPVAMAGNDTIIVADTGVLLIDAQAHNYGFVKWTTLGDGIFDNDTLVNATYFPGPIDTELGIVTLEMMVVSECGAAFDSLNIIIEPHFSIEGRLWTSQKTPYYGVVVAFVENDSGTRAKLFEASEADGVFRFPKVMKGNYYIYGLPDTNNFEDLVPGYYANKLRWQNAYLLPVDADVFDVDIYLPSVDFVLPIGEASISGHMLMPINSTQTRDIYCLPWFADNSNLFCNGGLSNSTVLLYNSDHSKLLDYTLTDEFGNFYFNEIPYGSYIVDAEKAGYNTIPSSLVTVSPDYPTETGIVIEITDFKMEFVLNSPTTSNDLDIIVFPNPTSSELNIHVSDDFSVCKLEIYNVFGSRIENFDNIFFSEKVKINIDILSPGIYIGKITSSTTSSQFRFIVE